MQIKKDEMFYFLEDKTGDEYYVFMHGIADSPDNENQFSNFSKDEKGQSILENGLFISERRRLAYTAMCYGNLAETYEKNKYAIKSLSPYKYYSPSGEYISLVIAVPIIFEDSKNRKIFGGWENCLPYVHGDREAKLSSISYQYFKGKIPSEFVLGYFSFSEEEDNAQFIENRKFYSNLSQEEKDEFIESTFDNPRTYIDLNSEENIDDQIKKLEIDLEVLEKHPKIKEIIKKQIEEYNSLEYQQKIAERKEVREKRRVDNPYTNEEIKEIDIKMIDIKRVQPNFDIIMDERYNFKKCLVQSKDEKKGVNRSLEEAMNYAGNYWIFNIFHFEEFAKERKYDINDTYKTWYMNNKFYFDELFIENLIKQKNWEIEKSSVQRKNINNVKGDLTE